MSVLLLLYCCFTADLLLEEQRLEKIEEIDSLLNFAQAQIPDMKACPPAMPNPNLRPSADKVVKNGETGCSNSRASCCMGWGEAVWERDSVCA